MTKLQIVLVLVMSTVACDAWFMSTTTCSEALTSYCGDGADNITVCAACPLYDDVLCNATQDPLLCYGNNRSPCGDTTEPCDSTLGFNYGCYNGYCWSQCVGVDYGDQEWCYTAKRQHGPRVDYTCEEDSDCQPTTLNDSIMCSGNCGPTGSFGK
ncbi:uncharacterized protein LOC124283150 [Haliotis rubra]|uniref:uncharacterized protein LOC124283150 n=1 Tax=Haliotis rubra TaxID=36100 RepID=UPI001EE5D365|nr:uncharacterized protein LOC124283150 [Haliotis rubra]